MKQAWLLLSLPIILLDQAVKFWAKESLLASADPFNSRFMEPPPQSFIPGIQFTYAENTGAAFSLLSGGGARWFLTIISALAAAAIIYIVCKGWVTTVFGAISISCVLGGAVGNLIDRALRGYVVDMFEFTFMNFAIFNVADIFISIGGVCFCSYLLLEMRKVKKNAPVDKNR
jgi:signal peptidase II